MAGDQVRDRTFRDVWRTWTRTPPAALAGLVDYHGFVYDSGTPATDVVYPSPKLTMILSFGDELRMEQMPGRAAAGGPYVSFVAGLHGRPGVIGHDGHQAGIQVDLDPLVARAVLGLSVGELAGEVVPADAVLGTSADRLVQRLAEAADWPSRFTLLDDVLRARVARASGPRPELVHAWRRLRGSHGTARVDDLAGEVGWSRRHLADRFRHEIGLTPKAAARVVRFDRARWMVATGAGSLTDVALRCGYYDHAHLARDFRALAGGPPTAVGDLTRLVDAERDLPFVQDAAARPG